MRKTKRKWLSTAVIAAVIGISMGGLIAHAAQPIAGKWDATTGTYVNFVNGLTGTTPISVGLNANMTFDWNAPGLSVLHEQIHPGPFTTYTNAELGLTSQTLTGARLTMQGNTLVNNYTGLFQTQQGYYLNFKNDEFGKTKASVGVSSSTASGSGFGSGTSKPNDGLNWFAALIVDAISSIINLVAVTLEKIGINVPHVILSGMMLTKAPFGQANWSDLLGSANNQATVSQFQTGFTWLASLLLLMFIYTSGVRITKASNSSIQRDRLKNELVGLVGAGVFLALGPYFAGAITQIAYAAIHDLLAPAMQNIKAYKLIAMGASPINNLIYSVDNLISVIAAVVMFFLYGFRQIFVDVWAILFPVAMVMYANEHTRPFYKMWWTEWIYQMLIPVAQSLVYAIASGLANVSGASDKVAMSLGDVFTSITGVIAIFFVASTVRKMVDTVASSFHTSALGMSTSGGMIGAAAGAFLGDKMAAPVVKAATKPMRMAGKAAFKAVDRSSFVRNKLTKVMGDHPELAASHVANGGTLDSFVQDHLSGGSGANDPVHFADGMGIPNSAKHGSRAGGGNSQSRTGGRSAHNHPMFHSDTAQVIGGIAQDAKDTMRNSRMGLIAKSWKANLGNGGMRKTPEMQDFRSQIRNTSDLNASQNRAANVAGGVHHQPTESEPWSQFVGSSPNIEKHNSSVTDFRTAMKNAGANVPDDDQEFREQINQSFAANATPASYLDTLQSTEDPVKRDALQSTFERARTTFAPAAADMQTIRDIESGKVEHLGAYDRGGRIDRPRIKMSERFTQALETQAADLRAHRLLQDQRKTDYVSKKESEPFSISRRAQTRERARNVGIVIE